MRLLSFALTGLLFAASLHGKWHAEKPIKIPLECHGGETELLPILRLAIVPRFFEDTSAITLLGEYGRGQNRVNATVGFPITPSQSLKIGGELLNQQLSFHFPFHHDKAWVRQYAAGAAYQAVLNFWGLKTLDISGQWSNAQNRSIYNFHNHRDFDRFLRHHHISSGNQHHPRFQRSIAGSKAYAFTAGLSLDPWYWATLKGEATYDHVRFERKRKKNQVISGFGGNVWLEQRLSESVSLVLKGEFRAPYTYYEGNIWWKTPLAGTDVVIGGFGGHTQGRKGLPSNTVVGLEIGFDFGLSNYSMSRSAGVCGNASEYYCQSSLGCLDRQYLQWIATPAVYMPEVLAVGEQHVLIHKIPRQ